MTSNTADPSGLVTVSMEYDAANRLTKYNGQTVEYDAKGNMTTGPVDGEMQELTYDCRNRLIEAGGVSYTYDAENTRIATTVDGKTTEYVTDTGGSMSRMLIAYEADGTETSYYYGAEGLAGQYNSGTKEKLYYHYDNIGSTTLLTDAVGKIVDRFVYGTYGELLSEVTKKVRFLFNGAYGVTTDENGLYYMRARYYNPDIKRFINQDIKVGDIGSSQSLNRYAYCEGNPVSLIDPFGLSPQGTNGIWDILGAILSELTIHDLLGAAGFIPGVGVVADVADTVIYYCEGHPVEGTISLLCALPGIGDAFGISVHGSKIAKTGKRIANLLIDAGKNTKTAAKVADAAKTAKNLIKFAGGKAGDFAHAAGKMIIKGFKAGASKLDDAVNLIRHQGDKLYTSAKNAVKKLKGGSNKSAFDYYMNLVEKLDVSTAKDTAIFYSGEGNRALAEQFAKLNGKTTLEMPVGGKYLDGLKLFEEGSPLTQQEATNVWARLSARYAQNASGNVYGFVKGS